MVWLIGSTLAIVELKANKLCWCGGNTSWNCPYTISYENQLSLDTWFGSWRVGYWNFYLHEFWIWKESPLKTFRMLKLEAYVEYGGSRFHSQVEHFDFSNSEIIVNLYSFPLNLKRMEGKWLICVLFFQFSFRVGCLCVLVNSQVWNKKKQLVNWTSTAYKDITF